MKPIRALAFMAAIFAIPIALALILWACDVRSRASWEPLEPNPLYIVVAGDTLWSIARANYPDADPRAVVYAIQQLNEVDPGRLRPGDVLVLPKEVR